MADLTAAFDPVICASSRSERAVALATLLGRIGDEGAAKAVEEAIAETDAAATYVERALGTALALEAAWLGLFDEADALTRYRSLLGMSALAGDPWTRERLGFWAIRLGVAPPGDPLPGPVGLEAAGDGAAAARMWEKLGYPVEAAVTAAGVPGAALNESFTLLDEIGAVGVSAALRRRLRQLGVRGVPRGDRPSTSQHPDGLTRRQAEVLALLAKGMTDAAIARELFISARTASHHVSAILRKLGVANRGEAIAQILAAADS
jgi:DNA-binding CsgD family transcriptional regulator